MSRKDQHLDRLQQVPTFRGLSRKELEVVGRQADTVSVEAGRTIVREGEHGEEFFVVLSGKVAVVSGGREVATLGEGDFFGELALFDPAPRDATVTATVPTELLVVHANRFQPLLDDVPLLGRKVTAALARRLREADTARTWQ